MCIDGSDQRKKERPQWRRGQEKSHRKTEGEDLKESRENGVKLGLHRAPVESQELMFSPRDLGLALLTKAEAKDQRSQDDLVAVQPL